MSQVSPLSDGEFTSAVNILRKFVSDDELDQHFPLGPAAIYTTAVTIWMMLLQRLGGGKSLAAVVKEVQNYNRDLLPNLRCVEEKTLSYNSTQGAQSTRPCDRENGYTYLVSTELNP